MKTQEELETTYRNYFCSPSGAVFNCHVNDAEKRAKQIMGLICPKLLEELEDMIKQGNNGILVIFDSKPTQATMVYIMLVNAFVLEV